MERYWQALARPVAAAPPDCYPAGVRRPRSSLVLVVGASLLALGLGNTAMGLTKLSDYGARMEAAVATGGESARKPAQGTASILDPSTDAQLLYESAFLKFEYYRVVLRGGLMLLALGSLLIGVVVVRKFLAWGRVRREPFALRQS